jgi:outer membrane protein TolC
MRLGLPSWFGRICCAVSLPILTFGQQPATALSLADCIRLASAAPSPVSVARQEVRIAESGVTAARSGLLPHAGLSGGAIYNTPREGGQAFAAFNGAREYLGISGVSLDVDTSGRLRALYARAKIDRDIADTETRLSERDLRRAVSQAFFRVLMTRKLAGAAAASLAEAQKFESRVKLLVSGGESAQADLVKASAQVAAFEQQKTAAELEARLANQELASFWTTDVDTPLPLQDSLSAADAGPPATETPGAFLRRPEFRVLDLRQQGHRLNAKAEFSALLPQVSLGYQYGIDANRFAWRERGTAAIASLNVPLFDWFRARSLAQQFTLRAEQVVNTRHFTERAFSREYESAKARVASVWEQLRAAEAQVTLSEQNMNLSEVRYAGGEGPALEVVVAQTQLQQARANYFTTLFLYVTAKTDLEVAAGR